MDRDELTRRLDQARESHVLDLSDCDLHALPTSIERVNGIEVLKLDGNHLTEIPSNLLLWPNLDELHLARNRLTRIPPEIGRLDGLRVLYLDRNLLDSLPPELGNLASLKKLSLDGNQLRLIPEEIGRLTQLETIWLGGNPLEAMALDVSRMAELSDIYLDYLPELPLPRGLEDLVTLRRVVLTGSNLRWLPCLRNSPQLKHIQLSSKVLGSEPPSGTLAVGDNPLPAPLLAAMADGIEALWSYLETTAERANLGTIRGKAGEDRTTDAESQATSEPLSGPPSARMLADRPESHAPERAGYVSIRAVHKFQRAEVLSQQSADRLRRLIEPFIGLVEELLQQNKFAQDQQGVADIVRLLRHELFGKPAEPNGAVVYGHLTSLLKVTVPILDSDSLKVAERKHSSSPPGCVIRMIEASMRVKAGPDGLDPLVDALDSVQPFAPDPTRSGHSRVSWVIKVLGFTIGGSASAVALGASAAQGASALGLSWLPTPWAAVAGAVIGMFSSLLVVQAAHP